MDAQQRRDLRKWFAQREKNMVVCRVYGHVKPNILHLGKSTPDGQHLELDLDYEGRGGWALILHCLRDCSGYWPQVVSKNGGHFLTTGSIRYDDQSYLRGKKQGGDGYTMSKADRDYLRQLLMVEAMAGLASSG